MDIQKQQLYNKKNYIPVSVTYKRKWTSISPSKTQTE